MNSMARAFRYWSEEAYFWIDEKSVRFSLWLDRNIGRLLVVAVAAGLSVFGYQQPEGSFLKSISPELIGIVLTAVVIDFVNERRHKLDNKELLITQFGSESRDMARMAHLQLWNNGWLYDGSLAGAFLEEGNLRGLNLGNAVLKGASLYKANLSRTILKRADLKGANLWEADLSEADLEDADVSGAYLTGANLSKAYMRNANLSGASSNGANLSSAKLYHANLMNAELVGIKANRVDLPWANLTGTKLLEACLTDADLTGANLSGADMELVELNNAWLKSAILNGAYLIRADLREANLDGAYFWTIKQLRRAHTLEGAIMPDKIQLGKRATGEEEAFAGPTFKEWAASYLAKNGGTEDDLRDTVIRPEDLVQMESTQSGSRSNRRRRRIEF